MSEQHFGIAEDSGERIINLVAEDRADVARQVGPLRFRHGFQLFRSSHSALDQAGGRGDEISGARHEFHFSRSHEGRDFRLPVQRR